MKSAPIPPPCPDRFSGGIVHPDLFLWDSWCCDSPTGIDLFCLALARKNLNEQRIEPSERNKYFFHIRHFHSDDQGSHWTDKGCIQEPGQAQDGHDARNIWSGSVLELKNSGKLFAYTGIREVDEEHPFVQSLGVGHCSKHPPFLNGRVILCPIRDREQILAAGYYLPEPGAIGHINGEEGGPILAWRDPFLFQDNDGSLMMAWAAKTAPNKGAVGLASLEMDDRYKVRIEKLFPPITMPDDDEFTQLEVPKIIFVPSTQNYILCISTTNRQSESQSQSEVAMEMRLYFSDDLTSGWTPGGTDSSVLSEMDNLFGMSVLSTDSERNLLYCLAPYTEIAGEKLQLTFPSRFVVNLAKLGQDAGITAFRENGIAGT